MSHTALLVGLGQIAVGYDIADEPSAHVYTHAKALTEHPDFCLSGGVDPQPAQRKRFEDTYDRPAYASVGEACEAMSADVVVIATPTPSHSETLNALLDRTTPRAILCEKPLAYELGAARQMVARCESSGVRLFANYMRRAEPAVIEIRRRLIAGEIAGPVKGVVWYSKGFLHNGSHFFNLLEFWFGPMVQAHMIDRGRACDHGDSEPDVQVTFEAGSAVFLAAREENFSHYTVELIASNGRLRYEQGGDRVVWQATQADSQFPGYTVLSEEPELLPSGMARYQWHVADQLSNALRGAPTTLSSGEEALATLVSMKRITEAS